MKFHSLILDNFFDNPDKVRDEAVSNNHEGLVNPYDGVFYPDINIQFSPETVKELVDKLSTIMQGTVKPSVIFTRLSKKGVKAPHQAHTDTVMNRFTCLVYLNKPEDCQGGTELIEHVSGKLSINPTTQDLVDLWKQDTNVFDKWKVVSNCSMKFNRCFIIDSDLFHRAMPTEGFGDTLENGRLVMTCFFSLDGR